MRKERSSRHGKELSMSFGNSTNKLFDDKEQEETEQKNEENENESSIDVQNKDTSEMMRIPEITTEELQTEINILKKKANLQTATVSEPKTSELATMRRKKMVRQVFNEIVKQNEFTPEAWQKVRIKVIHKKGDVEDVGNCRPICSLPALYKLSTTTLYSRLYPRLDQIPSGRSGGIQKLLPNNRPSCDVQNDRPEMPRVENQNVGSDNRLHEGVRLHHTQLNLGRPETHSTDRRRK